MKNRKILIFLMCFFSFITIGSAFADIRYSTTEFLVKDSETFTLNAPQLHPAEISLLRTSLNELKYSRGIKDFEENVNSSFTIKFADKNTRKILLSDGNIVIEEIPTSYIVKFKNPSIIEQEKILEKEIEDLRQQSAIFKEAGKNSKAKTLAASANKKEARKTAIVESYKKTLKSEHTAALKDIKKIASSSSTNSMVISNVKRFTGNIISKITGADISENPIIIKPDEEFYTAFNGIVLNLSAEDVEKVAQSKYVEDVYQNKKVTLNLMDSVPLIGANAVWKEVDDSGEDLTGKGVSIAVIDTGVDYTHPDLGECTTQTFLAGKCTKVVAGYDFVNKDNDPMDDQGHGTHVASTAAGSKGLNGVAPGAEIYAYKVLNSEGSGTWSDIIAAIERAVDPNQDKDTSDHLDIISMSLGGDGNPDDPISQAVDNAADAGVLSVIAAGNSGPWARSVGSPGTSRKALTVGATYKKDYSGEYWENYDPKADNITSFSSRGPVIWGNGLINKPDVVAPGALICAARYDNIFPEGEHKYYKPCLDDKHVLLAGTSMATPIVSGLAALVKQKYPQMTPEEIKNLIKLSAKDLENNIYSQGTGRVDAKGAIEMQFVATGELDFGIFTPGKTLNAQRNLSFKNIGTKEVKLSIKAENALEFQGNAEFNPLQLSETEVTLAPGEKKNVEVNIELSADDSEGFFIGKIIADDGTRKYILPYTFGKLSELKLTLEGKHYPDFRAIGSNMDIAYGANQDWDFNGNSVTLPVKSGTYTVFAINPFVDDSWPFSDSEEYYVIDMVDVPMNEKAEKTLKLSDAEKFIVKTRAKDNSELNVYEWYKGLSVYINKTYGCASIPKEDCNTNIDCRFNEIGNYCYDKVYSWTASDSSEKKGDRTVWISKKPDNDLHIDMILRYLGVPNA